MPISIPNVNFHGLANLKSSITNLLKTKKYSHVEVMEFADELANVFPLLHYRKKGSVRKAIDELKSRYPVDEDLSLGDIEAIDKEFLSEVLFDLLQFISLKKLPYIDLDAFNKIAADDLADNIVSSSRREDYARWFDEYESVLYHYLMRELQLINHKKWDFEPYFLEVLGGSFSYLWKNRKVDRLGKLLCEIADAHAFIQATSCSTQNENSFLAFFDGVNYLRSYKQISEFKFILGSLVQPFQPLYYEYRDIALYKSGPHYKFFRIMMPILVVTMFMILISSLLTEAAFGIAFIPALMIGVALASQYVWLKNTFYNFFHEWDGPYNIKEFKVNERMRRMFKNDALADEVRYFYVNELEKCDNLAKDLLKNKKWPLKEEQEQMAENQVRRDALCLEWFDIHSNENVPIDYPIMSKLVLAQIKNAMSWENDLFKDKFKEEKNDIAASARQFTSIFRDTLACPIYADAEAKKVRIPHSPRLFQPANTLLHKRNLERMGSLCESLKASPSPS